MQAWPALPFPTLKGQIRGHEGVGMVVKHGPGVTNPALKSRVGIKWLADVCNNCRKLNRALRSLNESV
jgi:alcohol dehydrogenase, propanol-preferring